MFYNRQPAKQQESYKHMLQIVGSLSRMFSEAAEPYLYYRAHENIFAKYFDVENNARHDDSADAYSQTGIGIGLKTWVGGNNQKIAEFGRLRPEYESLSGMDLIRQIAEYRNERIRVTMASHGLHEMLYHIVKRVPGAMCIYEAAYDTIDIGSIDLDPKRGTDNSIYFSDGKHTYHFSLSKNTLYMNFDEMELLDKFNVDIADDPYALLENLQAENVAVPTVSKMAPLKNQLCLRLYSVKADGTKFIPDKSGLNQWNGVRTSYKKDSQGKTVLDANGNKILTGIKPRNPNELYIPYPAKDRERKDFFPSRNTPFQLMLPDGKCISAKVCQMDGKAIMSNPNDELGKWLLRKVFGLKIGTKVTYSMLKTFGIDCVVFTKLSEKKYSIDFGPLGTYEKFYNEMDADAKYDDNDEAKE